MLQLNSFENRVLLVQLEDGGAVVAKFYRPGRWSDGQILEEHAFSTELAASEVPVAAPLADASGRTLHAFQGDDLVSGEPGDPEAAQAAPSPWRFAVFDRMPGRGPELEQLSLIHI